MRVTVPHTDLTCFSFPKSKGQELEEFFLRYSVALTLFLQGTGMEPCKPTFSSALCQGLLGRFWHQLVTLCLDWN